MTGGSVTVCFSGLYFLYVVLLYVKYIYILVYCYLCNIKNKGKSKIYFKKIL